MDKLTAAAVALSELLNEITDLAEEGVVTLDEDDLHTFDGYITGCCFFVVLLLETTTTTPTLPGDDDDDDVCFTSAVVSSFNDPLLGFEASLTACTATVGFFTRGFLLLLLINQSIN